MNHPDHNRMHCRLLRWAAALATAAALLPAQADVMPVEETASMVVAPSSSGTAALDNAAAQRAQSRPAAVPMTADSIPASASSASVTDRPLAIAESAVPESTVAAVAARGTARDAVPGNVFAAAAVSADRLAANRAGATTNNIDIAGTLKDATVTNVVTGTNSIRDNSFANALGINTVIQNSGANVLIQNSTVVNVQLY